MKIAYWLGKASINGGGASPYAWRVLEVLLCHHKKYDIELSILCNNEIKNNCIDLAQKYNVSPSVIVIPDNNNNRLKRLALIIGITIEKLLKKVGINSRLHLSFDAKYRWFSSLDIDLLYIPYQTPPMYDLPYPYIVTMHDVQELHFPEFFTPDERAYRAEYYWKSLKYASSVVVSFNHVKQDIIKYFHLPESKIYVCPLPYRNIQLASPTQEETELYRANYSNLQNFILYPAQTWKHKNHLSLIQAIEEIKDKYNREIHCVCTGRKNQQFFPVLENYLKESSVSHLVHFAGIVPESELYWLYKNCNLVVIPTLYEAGSFPLMEAMFLEVPVICSSVTSLPETIEDKRFTFEPLDVKRMSDLIIKMTDDSEFRLMNLENSQKRAKELKAINSVDFFLKAFNSAMNDDLCEKQ